MKSILTMKTSKPICVVVATYVWRRVRGQNAFKGEIDSTALVLALRRKKEGGKC